MTTPTLRTLAECPDWFLVGTVGQSFVDPVAEYFSREPGGDPQHLHVYRPDAWRARPRALPATLESRSQAPAVQEPRR
jgi:hypothetical protein